MGREIRRVPPNWQHPRYTINDAPSFTHVGEYKSLYDKDYETAAREWMEAFDLWRAGKHKDQPCDYAEYFWDYDSPPDKDLYRPKFETEPTWFQVYETVSEGSPVTPPFATPEELVEYLVAHGDAWDQKRRNAGWDRAAATAFVSRGWAPSMMVRSGASGTNISEPRDAEMYEGE